MHSGNGAMTDERQVLDTITQAKGGMTLAELLAQRPTLARRTAQRWISLWITQERLRAQGEGRARRYFAQAAVHLVAPPSWAAALPLSPDSKDILAYIEKPLTGRKPVGYQPEFLQSYQPGVTWYLPLTLRRQLRKMGQTMKVSEPAGTYSRAILSRLLIDLSWASSHLEGNTYSRLDTRELIEHGKAAQGKGAIETQMILNHKSAIELLVENIAVVGFNRFTLMNLHSALAENLLPNPADEGRIRKHAVDIGLSVFRPLSVPAQIEAAFDLMLDKVNQITDPFEQSFFMMVHLPYLQPFADINKRTSRLVANLPLFRANLCPLTFLDVPESAYARAILGVYEMTRVELMRDLFVWAYERSTQEYQPIKQDLAEPDPLRLAWRDVIKKTIRKVVMHPDQDAMALIIAAVDSEIPKSDQADLHALIADELRRLHEGVLARYGLRPSEFAHWKSHQN
jgi:Fic family protein